VTLNAEKHLSKSLLPVINSPLKPKVLVMDSSSNDNTVRLAKNFGAGVVVIPKSEFNHGATREKGRKILDTDIVVFQTQDAYPKDETMLGKLIRPIEENLSEIAYGRQVPHRGSKIFEAFPREFNYPAESNIRSIEDIDKFGVYTFFNSHSWAAYLNSALDKCGGVEIMLSNEDYFTAAKLLKEGFKISYVSESIVEHSHKYSLVREFKRYFDTGYVRSEYLWVTKLVGQAETRGSKLVKNLIEKVIKEKPWLLPYAIVSSMVKWAGYRAGYFGSNLPKWMKKLLSEQSYYWDSIYYKRKK
jgi:rhamnosyltransferase